MIRSNGASSALAILLRDILYCFTEEEYSRRYLKNCYMLKNLYSIKKREKNNDDRRNDESKNEDLKKEKKSKSDKNDWRFLKVGRTLGIDMHGNCIEKEKSFAILYERILLKIPTTTNHCESYHSKINSVAAERRLTINNKLSLVACHIMKRLKHLDSSSIANLRNYLRKIRQKAKDVVEANPENLHLYDIEFCECKKSMYYSTLYNINLPCIHMILNEKWERIDISNFLEKISVEEECKDPLKCFEIPDQRPSDDNENDETNVDEIDGFPSDENILQDLKKYEDPIENLIYITYKQLKNVCK